MKKTLDILAIGNAASSHIRTRTKVFSKLGHMVRLLTPTKHGIPQVSEITMPKLALWKPPFATLHTFRRAWREFSYLRNLKADIYHIHYAYSLTAWLALAAGKGPIVVSTMGSDVLYDERTKRDCFGEKLTTLLIQNADLVTAKTTQMRQRLIELGAKEQSTMTTVWGIDSERFHLMGTQKLRQELGLGKDARIIFSPRSVDPIYNIDTVLKGFATVLKEYPSAVLLQAAGHCVPDYLNTLREQVEALGIESSVRFLDQVPHDRMAEFYALADVTVSLAEKTEGLAQSLLESMACGTPTIATRLDRYLDIMKDGDNSILIEPTHNELAKAIATLLGSPEIAKAISKSGMEDIRNKADLEAQAKNVESRLLTLAAQPHMNIPRSVRIKACLLIFTYIFSAYISNFKKKL